MSLCLRPLDGARQQVLGFGITTSPPGKLTTEIDPFGNTRHVLTVNESHHTLEVVSVSTVDVLPTPPVLLRLGPDAWEVMRDRGPPTSPAGNSSTRAPAPALLLPLPGSLPSWESSRDLIP